MSSSLSRTRPARYPFVGGLRIVADARDGRRYRTQADCDSHASSDAYLEMTQEFQRERLIARAPTVMTLTSVAGFDHRL